MRKKKKVNANETYMQTVMRRFRAHHLAKISLVILVVVGLAALFAPVVAPYDPDAIVGTFSGAPCLEHWLGTDQIGRDVLSRLLYAMRIFIRNQNFSACRNPCNSDLHGNRSGTRSDRGIFWRCGGYDPDAFYGYGDVISLYPSCARCGGNL